MILLLLQQHPLGPGWVRESGMHGGVVREEVEKGPFYVSFPAPE